ncbi:helix-turn-helix domain-containing protein [Tumebacillus flagellatus]|uniref:HTH cro/C1-type domain-containing protein n=1 Tax=Tumebacillus flagellatus TaxID=1157490 RepID=A0A074LH87_9BACL|nr:helix-turn-helix transcriptional regulator [Tumebacillus flagellatus]KEO81586.1 hypothetical protein EL26_20085 [Tumebacillus flagellatus]
MNKLGEKIKACREAKGWNQKELAERADVSPATVSAVENGRFVPSPDVVHRIAAELGVKFYELAELLLPARVDTALEIGRQLVVDVEFGRVLRIVQDLQEQADLLEYQADELARLEAHVLLFWPESRMQSIETLYALSSKTERAAHADPTFAFRVQNTLGIAWHQNYDFITALHHFTRAKEILSFLPDHGGLLYGRVLYNISDCLRYVGRDEEAITHLEKAIPLFQQEHHFYSVGACYYAIGISLKNLGRMQEAAEACRQSVPWFEKTQNQSSKWFATRARSYASVWNPDLTLDAVARLEEELRELRDRMPPKDVAVTTTRIAKVYLDLHMLAEAKSVLEKVEPLCASLHPCGERAFFLLNYAKYHFAVGDYDSASSYAFEAADLYASLRFFHTDLQECLRVGKEAVYKLREEGACG